MWSFLQAVALALSLWTSYAEAAQPSAPKPVSAPLRDLHFQQLNVLHTTDIHGWLAGHLLEPQYSADWGDYLDFADRLREQLGAEDKDLLVIDTGDRVEGNGLYDAASHHKQQYFDILKEQHIDLICTGNHELYKQYTSENEYLINIPSFGDNYLASNLDIYDPRTGELVPMAPRFKKFTTKKQGIRIMAFAFLYDFRDNSNNTIVQPVEDAIKKAWFKDAIRDQEVDLFMVIGHAPVRSEEFDLVYAAIRSQHHDTPIHFFGGHFHIRDYRKFDDAAYGLASGRYMETIGFASIGGLRTHDQSKAIRSAPTFFRRYLDNNLYSFYHHSGHNASNFHSKRGRRVSKAIAQARTELTLDETFGCTGRDLWMSRAPYPSNDSIFTWLEEQVLPQMNDDPNAREALVLTNTGAIRYDIFKGAFTKDSTFIISPFTSSFHYIKDVPLQRANKVISLLNDAGQVIQAVDSSLDSRMLRPPEQYSGVQTDDILDLKLASNQVLLGHQPILTPGYTTHDDAGQEGDDTIHTAIKFYQVPNCIQARIGQKSDTADPETIDFVFNEFTQPWVLLAFRFLGLDYTTADVGIYLEGKTLTSVISDWVKQNWKENC